MDHPLMCKEHVRIIPNKSFHFWHRFSLSITPHNGQAGEGYLDGDVEEGSSSGLTTIIVVVLVLVLAIIAAAGTVFYAKKTQRWCFAQPEPRKAADRRADPEIEAPLNEDPPNARPIIKHKYSRPE